MYTTDEPGSKTQWDGNPENLDFLYGKPRAIAFAMMNRNGISEEDRPDLFQDAAIALHKRISKPDFSLESSIESYFYGIIRHLIDTYHRRENARRNREQNWSSDNQSNEDSHREYQKQLAVVKRELLALSNQVTRRIYILKYGFGLSYEEIIMQYFPNMTVGQLASRIYDTNKRIKRRLGLLPPPLKAGLKVLREEE